jgi:hypothetical protein
LIAEAHDAVNGLRVTTNPVVVVCFVRRAVRLVAVVEATLRVVEKRSRRVVDVLCLIHGKLDVSHLLAGRRRASTTHHSREARNCDGPQCRQ